MTSPRLLLPWVLLLATGVVADAEAATTIQSGGCTIYVPDDHATIQAAINASTHGDEIVVRAGTYAEHHIDFGGRAITLRSEAGPASTIVDGQGMGSVVVFTGGEGRDSALEGFTITNGHASFGGGIQFGSSSSPTVRNCIVDGNQAVDQGGGMIIWLGASPLITECTISNNELLADNIFGGGIFCGSGSPVIEHSTIRANRVEGGNGNMAGGGIYLADDSSATVRHCLITENVTGSAGGGIYCDSSNATLHDCLITGNTATSGTYGNGGGILFGFDASPTVTFCTIADNSVSAFGDGGGVYCKPTAFPTLENCILWGNQPNAMAGGGPTASYTCIQGGWPGVGNFSADPLFASGPVGDYYLDPGSPCIDAGDPAVVAYGSTQASGAADTGVVDLGDHHVEIERPLTYSIGCLMAGTDASFDVRNATPGGTVLLGYSLTGPGPTNTPYGMADMSPPISLLASLVADAQGSAGMVQTVPLGASGRTLYTQGVDLASGALTNSLAIAVP